MDGDNELSPLGVLVAECVAAVDREGLGVLEEFCSEHPEHADALRARVSQLQDLGLVDAGDFGPYRILRTLGAGGMGVVHLVRDERLDRTVALKVMPAHLATVGRARLRFEREARAAARLAHERIVPVFDVGDWRGVPYFTMEYVEGRTLAEALDDVREARNSRQTGVRTAWRAVFGTAESHVWTAVHVALDIAGALDHAHAHAVVHRDVKPANIMLRPDGRALLFDFGLAHLDDDAGPTRSGDLTGTPAYMAPEQTAGGDVDARTDVFGLGVVLFEALTLARPFDGAGAHASPSRSLRSHNADVSNDLEVVCMKALERRPEQRYAAAGEFAADLRRVLAFEPILARRPSAVALVTRFMLRRPAVAIASVLAAIIVVGLPVILFVSRQHIAEERDHAAKHLASARAQERLAQRELERGNALLERADTLNGFILEMLTAPLRNGRAHDVRVVDVLAEASRRAGESGRAELEVALRGSIAATQLGLGLLDEAEPELRRALELCESPGSPVAPVEHMMVLSNLGALTARRGDVAASIELMERAVAIGRAPSIEHSRQHATVLGNLAASYLRAGDLERGRVALEEALATHRTFEDPMHSGQIEAEINLSLLYDSLGRVEESFALADDVLPRAKDSLGAGHPTTLTLIVNVAASASLQGDDDRAAELLAAGDADGVAMLGDAHPHVGKVRALRSIVLERLGEHQRAAVVAQGALAGLAILEPGGGTRTYETLVVLAGSLLELGSNTQAREVAAAAVELAAALPGLTWPLRWKATEILVEALTAIGRGDEAASRAREFAERCRDAGGAEDVIKAARAAGGEG